MNAAPDWSSRGAANAGREEFVDRAFWPAQIVGWLVLAVFGFCLRLIVFRSLPVAFEATLIVDTMGLVLTSLMARQPFMRVQPGKVVRSLALAVVWCTCIALILSFVAYRLRIALTPLDHHAVQGSRFAVGLMYYMSIITAWTLACLGRRSEIEARAQRMQALTAEARALRIELESLHVQIAPHFLFNVLNTLVAEIAERPDIAEKMTRQLAAYLRYSLAKGGQYIGPVAEELEAVEMYVRIQALRFDERFSCVTRVDAHALDASIPHMAIQCLVENAIKHGLQAGSADFQINIHVTRHDGELVIEVDNPCGSKILTQQERTGTGLANMRRRIELRYPGRHAFSLRQDRGLTTATLKLRGDPCSA